MQNGDFRGELTLNNILWILYYRVSALTVSYGQPCFPSKHANIPLLELAHVPMKVQLLLGPGAHETLCAPLQGRSLCFSQPCEVSALKLRWPSRLNALRALHPNARPQIVLENYFV